MGLTAELAVAAYEGAGSKERKLVRDLVRKGSPREVEVVIELLHYFPGAYLVKTPERLPEARD
jgi:hypothetical protein